MTDGWSWTFGSDNYRTRVLRDRLAELEGTSATASARAARLSSQLAQLQGSLESRLTALSRAFDAYVELGDVREELLQFAGTAEVRRRALATVEAIGQGRPPAPMPEDVDYWLVPAMRAVVALAGGARDVEAEQRAMALERQAPAFIVAVLAAVGHGPRVADRLPDALTNDGSLDEVQQAIWAGVVEGLYGPGVLPALRGVLPVRDDRSTEWQDWVAEQGGRDAVGQLGWLEETLRVDAGVDRSAPQAWTRPGANDLVSVAERPAGGQAVGSDPRAWLALGDGRVTATPGANDPTPATAVELLKTCVAEIIAAGRSDERDLLARAKVLREAIEHPEQDTAAVADRPPLATEVAVREALRRVPIGSAEHAELVSWAAPGLRPVIDRLGQLSRPGTAEVSIRTPGGQITVTEQGPDPQGLQRAKQTAASALVRPTRRNVLTGLAGLLLVLTIVFVIIGPTALWVICLIATIGCGVGAVFAWREIGQDRAQRALDVAETDRLVSEATTKVKELSDANAAQHAEITRLLASITDSLGRLAADGPSPARAEHGAADTDTHEATAARPG